MMNYALLVIFSALAIRLADSSSNSTNFSIAQQLQQVQKNFISSFNAVTSNYDKKLRPNILGPPVHVQIELKVVSFGPVNEEKQEYDLDIVFRQWWKDELLQGAVKQPVTMAVDPGTLIWKPDTYFVNARESSFHEVTKDVMRFVLQPDGRVYYSSRISLTVTCQMDFSLFPMDMQKCPIYIESYSYTVQEVYYSWYKTNGKLAVTRGVEWIASDGPIFQLVNVVTHERDVSNNTKGAFSRLTAVFHLSRRYYYYVWNIYLPGGFLVVMTWVNFWIPSSAYPARVTVSVTSFLSTVLIISGAGRSLSKLSYLKAIDWFLIVNAGFIFMTLFEYVLVLHCNGRRNRETEITVHKKKKKKKKDESPAEKFNEKTFTYGKENHAFTIHEHSDNSGYLNNRENAGPHSRNNLHTKHRNKWMLTKLLHVLKTPGEKTGSEPPVNKFKGHPIDRLSRVIFPTGYILFIIVYLVYYINKYEKH